jgi:hypothetical protein
MTPEQAHDAIVGFLRAMLCGSLIVMGIACLLFVIAGWRSWGKKRPKDGA